MNSVYVVSWYEYFEGYSEPSGAFLSKESAEEFARKLEETHHRGGGKYKVLQVEIKDQQP